MIASLELCKELYELSGWDNTRDRWRKSGQEWIGPFSGHLPKGAYPAYDLGYLLRKLPEHITLQDTPREGGWYCKHGDYTAYADTPEDAACKLAVALLAVALNERGLLS